MIRINTNGTLDTTFGISGWTEAEGFLSLPIYSMLPQRDGSIIAVASRCRNQAMLPVRKPV